MSSNLSGVINMEYTTGGGFEFPDTSTTAYPATTAIISGQLSVISSFYSTISLACPMLAANTTTTFSQNVPLTSFPQTFALQAGQTALILPSVYLISPPPANVTLSPLCVQVNQGQQFGPSVRGPYNFVNPTIQVSARASAGSTAVNSFSLSVGVFAILLA